MSTSGFSRIPLITRCVVKRRTSTVDAMMCNISVLGAYLVVEPMLEEGENVQLRFLLPDAQPPIECDAEVTWVNEEWPRSVDSLPPGCGLRFHAMGPDSHSRIGALVEDYRHATRPLIARPVPHSGFTRVPYVQPCTITGDGGATTRGVICNISLLGLYVAVDPIPPFGADVALTMPLPGAESAVTLPATVAWINPDEPLEVESLPTGCGLRFVQLDDDVAQGITGLVEDFLSIPRQLPPWLDSTEARSSP
jgi:Tfp pilus assembly protein PilZ